MWYQNRTRYSGKVAVDLSHFRLWERIAAGSKPAIILEDDVHLTGNNWTQHLIDVLKQLPVVGPCTEAVDWVPRLAASACSSAAELQLLHRSAHCWVRRPAVSQMQHSSAHAYVYTAAGAALQVT